MRGRYARGVEIEATPEPTPEAAKAIEAALTARREQDEAAAGVGAWWRAGVEDAVRGEFARD